jgi:predicted transcriptional regulator of viral defense system
MNYIEFKNRYQNTPVINISNLEGLESSGLSLRDNISKWGKKGYVYRLKNDLYTLNDNDRKIGLSRIFVANYLYSPSYVSLEYALFHHGFIPETVHEVTSVSTAKTTSFKNHFGVFGYSTVKKELYFGFTREKDENGMTVLTASPEKALLDFIYLRYCRRKGQGSIEEFIGKNRLQNLNSLDKRKYREFLEKYPERCRQYMAAILKGGKK